MGAVIKEFQIFHSFHFSCSFDLFPLSVDTFSHHGGCSIMLRHVDDNILINI